LIDTEGENKLYKTYLKATSKNHAKPKRAVVSKIDDDDENEVKQSLFSISQAQHHYNRFIVRIHNIINSPSEYSNLFQLFETASEGDEILIDINSPGGVLDTAILISRAIRGCEATVKTRIGPTTASAATVIALACDGFEIDEQSTMQVHTASFSPGYAKTPDILASTLHNVKQIEKFVRNTYKHFLTEDEIQQVLDGREIYLDSDELSERLPKYVEERDIEMLAKLEEHNAEHCVNEFVVISCEEEGNYEEDFLETGEEVVDNEQEVVQNPPKPSKRRSKKG